jgi:hypothetical protein
VKAFRAWLGEHIGVDEEDELSLRDTHSPACPISRWHLLPELRRTGVATALHRT